MVAVSAHEPATHPTERERAPERARVRGARGRAARGRLRCVGWLMPPLLLAATACGVALVLRGPDRIFVVATGTLLAVAILWILVSSLLPARADRTCPACGAEALRRLDRATTRGILCTACGHVDPTQSSFLLAEEEGPLETIVIAERGRRAGSEPVERAR